MDRSDGPLAETPNAQRSALTKALCLDLPYIVDSVWRHAEYDANRLFSYRVVRTAGGVAVSLSPRAYTARPAFWFFLLTLAFVAYGPTFDAWCSIVGAGGMRYTREVLGALAMGSAAYVWWRLYRYGEERAEKRFKKAKPPVLQTERSRRFFVRIAVQTAILGPVAALALFGEYLMRSGGMDVCHRVPSAVPARLQLLVFFAAGALFWLLGRRPMKRGRIAASALLLIVMALLLWGVIAPPWASEANQAPYLHTYGIFACLLAALAVAAPGIAHWQMGSVSEPQRRLYQAALQATELFPASRDDPGLSTRRISAALATGVCYHALHFLLLPSFFALMVPNRYVLGTFLSGCIASAWLLMIGNLTPRWQVMVNQVRRWYLDGTPLAVSVGVVVLAILRLAKVQYVATILDAAPFGVIFTWIVMTYVLLWWFEYAVNGFVADELLGVFGVSSGDESLYVVYPATGIPEKAQSVRPDFRYIVAHGAGRFAALGWFMEKNDDAERPAVAFQTFDLMELFARLTPPGLGDFWQDLRRRIQLYFLTINALVAVIVAGGLCYAGIDDRHNSVDRIVSVKALVSPGRLIDLAGVLKGLGASTPAFVVAASGGGTRAAVYTATVLEGLRNLRVARNIVLLSGVSGGGVAVAYFYAHRDALLADGAASDAEWSLFKRRMAEPFIGDVLEGAGEWRVVSSEPLGRLLAESFERRLFKVGDRQATLGGSDRLALILNTTVTAHPQEDSELLRGAFPDAGPDGSCRQHHLPYALMSGGRLIFTNLGDRTAFPPSGAPVKQDVGVPLHIPDVRLPYVVVQDPAVPLAGAAALNANFPPVFTSAGVDVQSESADPACPDRTYYVTDGGASENLGLVSALYALRGAVAQLAAGEIPAIHIVTIEASEAGYDYTPDRGLNAVIDSAKERLTGGLTQELLNEIAQRIDGGGGRKLHIHDLALPLAFRSRDAFGTHWMFPGSVVIANPRMAQPLAWYKHLIPNLLSQDSDSAVLHQPEIQDLWTAMNDPDREFCTRTWAKDAGRVASWICGTGSDTANPRADMQIIEWRRLVGAVKSERP